MSQEVLHRPLNVAVLTVSDTRTMETDKGGNKVQELLEAANHNVVAQRLLSMITMKSVMPLFLGVMMNQ